MAMSNIAVPVAAGSAAGKSHATSKVSKGPMINFAAADHSRGLVSPRKLSKRKAPPTAIKDSGMPHSTIGVDIIN